MSNIQINKKEEKKCSYCNNTDCRSLLRCCICNKWFCNSTELRQGSHIYLHLSLTKHKCIATASGKTLNCSECKTNNVFDLRYDARGGANPKLLCVSGCLTKKFLASKNVDDSLYKPVVDNRRFDHSIIPVCPPSRTCAVDLTYELIWEFEQQKLAYPNIPITEVIVKPPINIHPTKDEYEDTCEYHNTYLPLLELEFSEQKKAMQMDGEKHVKVNFHREYDQRSGNFAVASFNIHMSEYTRQIKQWDELVLTWSFIQNEYAEVDGEIDFKKRLKTMKKRRQATVSVDESDGIVLLDDDELDETAVSAMNTHLDLNNRTEYVGRVMSLDVVDEALGYYTCNMQVETKEIAPGRNAFESGFFDIRLKEVTSVKERRLRAIERLDQEESLHGYLFDCIMGNKKKLNKTNFYIPKKVLNSLDYSVPNLRPLNETQKEAVKSALTSRLTLIQGPPGTGKTNTSAAIVYFLAMRARNNTKDIPRKSKESYNKPEESWKYKTPGRILVVAPSNVAADEICKRISKTGVKVVRLMAVSKQEQVSPVQDLCVHVKARKLLEESYPHQLKVVEKRKKGWNISAKEWASYINDVTICERKIITASEVVVSTCDSSGARVLDGVQFFTVLVDEASQATEPETLVPITHGAERIILVGDQRQLEPVVLSKQCKKCRYGRSLFERLIDLGKEVILLNTQYRMHPYLSAFSNHMFYQDKLKDGLKKSQRGIHPRIPYPNKEAPMLLWNVVGNETVGETGSSYMNIVEAKKVIELVQKLISGGIQPGQIGIITSYIGQKLLLSNMLMRSKLGDVELATVNTYQGREKDYIIYSCVRSNKQNSIGFLNDRRRLNVALTRARFGILVIGNVSLLMNDPIWEKYVDYQRGFKACVDGEIGHWKSY